MSQKEKYFKILAISYWLSAIGLLFFIPFSLCLLSGCNRTSRYKGFTTADNVTYMRYCDMGTTKLKLESGKLRIMETKLSFSKMNDSVFWVPPPTYIGYPFYYYFNVSELESGGTFERELLKAVEGDSIMYIVPSDSVFQHFFRLPLPLFLHPAEMMKVNVRVAGMFDSAQYEARIKTIKEYRKDMDMQEQLNLLHYVTSHNIPDSARKENIYIIPLAAGNGPSIKSQSTVSLTYKGYFLNGHMFDSVPAANPMQFRCSDKDQLIPGLEIAIKMMREGERAKIIIPSQLAFGEKGSLKGIIPPYSTLLYEVNIIEVKN